MKIKITVIAFLIISNSMAQSAIDELKKCEIDSIDGIPVYQIVENPPEFEGGLSSFYMIIAKNIKMPEMTGAQEPKSKFYISFIVDAKGEIQNFCATDIMKEVIDDEILEKLNKWQPGLQRGEKVPVRIQLPIIIDYYK